MKRTPLYPVHQELGARLVEFGGWEMPVQYSSILEEHQAVRERCGLFDVSHMGEIYLQGPDALQNVQHLITNDAARLEIGQIIYSPMCYPDGGIVDDLLVYRLGESEFLLVVNAANTDKDYDWVRENSRGEVEISNVSGNYALLALQGPASREILQTLTPVELDDLKYYWFTRGRVDEVEAIISRTGYTGELGYELYLPPDQAVKVWQSLMKAGKDAGLLPAGLGARDTLRLEKKFCLYGNDIDADHQPLEAGLGWTVKLSGSDFIGREALLNYREKGYDRKLVGFKLKGRGVARHGYKIQADGEDIGVVTSGSYSPTLEESIGLGYVQQNKAAEGQKLEIIIRGKPVVAEIVETPFVK